MMFSFIVIMISCIRLFILFNIWSNNMHGAKHLDNIIYSMLFDEKHVMWLHEKLKNLFRKYISVFHFWISKGGPKKTS